MYPRVKVSQQDELEKGLLLLLDNFNSLSLQDGFSLDKEHTSGSPPSVAKVPKSYVPSFTMPSVSVLKGKNNNEIEDDRPNIRASPVPRPRAVLSSPDNDGLIGSRNQLSGERRPTMNKSCLGENTDSQGKISRRSLQAKGAVNTKIGSKVTTNIKNSVNGKQGPEQTVPKQSGYLRKGRQRSTENPSSTILSHS